MVHELLMKLSEEAVAEGDADTADDPAEKMTLIGRTYPIAVPFITVAFRDPAEMERFLCLRAVHFDHLLSNVASHFEERSDSLRCASELGP